MAARQGSVLGDVLLANPHGSIISINRVSPNLGWALLHWQDKQD